jgi:hypothetical protein
MTAGCGEERAGGYIASEYIKLQTTHSNLSADERKKHHKY